MKRTTDHDHSGGYSTDNEPPVVFTAIEAVIKVVPSQRLIAEYKPKLTTGDWWFQVGMIVLFLTVGTFY